MSEEGEGGRGGRERRREGKEDVVGEMKVRR